MDKWIYISEKLPPEEQEFLAYSEIWGIVVTRFEYIAIFKVTAWMPLPEKPIKKDNKTLCEQMVKYLRNSKSKEET